MHNFYEARWRGACKLLGVQKTEALGNVSGAESKRTHVCVKPIQGTGCVWVKALFECVLLKMRLPWWLHVCFVGTAPGGRRAFSRKGAYSELSAGAGALPRGSFRGGEGGRARWCMYTIELSILHTFMLLAPSIIHITSTSTSISHQPLSMRVLLDTHSPGPKNGGGVDSLVP
jgi:hypothetical protein